MLVNETGYVIQHSQAEREVVECACFPWADEAGAKEEAVAGRRIAGDFPGRRPYSGHALAPVALHIVSCYLPCGSRTKCRRETIVILTGLRACRESLEGHLVGRSPDMPGYVAITRWLRRGLCRRHQQAPKIGSLHRGWESWSGPGMGLIADENSQHGPHCCSSHIGFALRKQLPRMWQSDGPLAPHCYHCALGTVVAVCMSSWARNERPPPTVSTALQSRKRDLDPRRPRNLTAMPPTARVWYIAHRQHRSELMIHRSSHLAQTGSQPSCQQYKADRATLEGRRRMDSSRRSRTMRIRCSQRRTPRLMPAPSNPRPRSSCRQS